MKNVLLILALLLVQSLFSQVATSFIGIHFGTPFFVAPQPFHWELKREFNKTMGFSAMLSANGNTGFIINLSYLRQFAFHKSGSYESYYIKDSHTYYGSKLVDIYEKRSGVSTKFGYCIAFKSSLDTANKKVHRSRIIGAPFFVVGLSLDYYKVNQRLDYSELNSVESVEITKGNRRPFYLGIYMDCIVPFNLSDRIRMNLSFPINLATGFEKKYWNTSRDYFFIVTPSLSLSYRF